MRARSSLISVLRPVVQVDRSQLAFGTAARNAAVVVAPLLVGAAIGKLPLGLIVSTGALNVSFVDQPIPYRTKAGRMILTGVAGAASVFVGSATGGIAWLAVLLVAIWGFGGGLLVAFGQVGMQVGLTSIILLLVLGSRPRHPAQAAVLAGLVLLGALLQTLVAVAPWPLRRFGPERAALATVYHQLAEYARSPTAPTASPPTSGALVDAGEALAEAAHAGGEIVQALSSLLRACERIRTDLVALSDLREQLEADDRSEAASRITAVLQAAAPILSTIADRVAAGRLPVSAPDSVRPLTDAAAALRGLDTGARSGDDRRVLAAAVEQSDALLGRLHTATRPYPPSRQEAPAGMGASRSWTQRLGDAAGTLAANLTLRSAACRHAIRLAACLAVADSLSRALALPRGYWVAMTAVIVLRPEFTSTFTRGVARLFGTGVGLVLVTALVHIVPGEMWGRIVLVGVLMFVVRALMPANYALAVIAMTGLVVVLLSFQGAPPEATIADRGLNTLIGGLLALVAFAVWPTWEKRRMPDLLADMLTSYRDYFGTMIDVGLHPGSRDHATLRRQRMAARLARSNAEASVERLRSEPVQPAGQLDAAEAVLASSNRFVHSALALEAALRDAARASLPASLAGFGADVAAALGELARAVRHGASPSLPDLQADARALAADTAPGRPDRQHPDAPAPRAILAAEADRIADSLTAMARVIGDAGKAKSGSPRAAPRSSPAQPARHSSAGDDRGG